MTHLHRPGIAAQMLRGRHQGSGSELSLHTLRPTTDPPLHLGGTR